MKIALHDSDATTYPNYAIMKISAYHKKAGDKVEVFDPFYRDSYDLVYSSKVFDFTPENQYLPRNTIKGGTGYGAYNDLPDEVDSAFPDYSIYPKVDYAVGFITRGCINNCDFCVVPKKEGKIRPYRSVKDLIRSDSNKLVLMDNNILASDFGIRELEKIAGSGIEVDLNQGMDIMLLTPEIIDLLSRIKWINYIRFSCDKMYQVDYFAKWMPLLRKKKMHNKLFIYLLVRRDVNDAATRVEELKKLHSNICIYAQAERNSSKGVVPTKEQLEFAQRYVYGRLYKRETFEEYKRKRGLKYVSGEPVNDESPFFARSMTDLSCYGGKK